MGKILAQLVTIFFGTLFFTLSCKPVQPSELLNTDSLLCDGACDVQENRDYKSTGIQDKDVSIDDSPIRTIEVFTKKEEASCGGEVTSLDFPYLEFVKSKESLIADNKDSMHIEVRFRKPNGCLYKPLEPRLLHLKATIGKLLDKDAKKPLKDSQKHSGWQRIIMHRGSCRFLFQSTLKEGLAVIEVLFDQSFETSTQIRVFINKK